MSQVHTSPLSFHLHFLNFVMDSNHRILNDTWRKGWDEPSFLNETLIDFSSQRIIAPALMCSTSSSRI